MEREKEGKELRSIKFSHPHYVAPKGSSGKRPSTPIYFLNNPLEEVLSFKLLGLTICHDLSWESHISKLASKASCRLGISSDCPLLVPIGNSIGEGWPSNTATAPPPSPISSQHISQIFTFTASSEFSNTPPLTISLIHV